MCSGLLCCLWGVLGGLFCLKIILGGCYAVAEVF